jgi:hypothetical protein
MTLMIAPSDHERTFSAVLSTARLNHAHALPSALVLFCIASAGISAMCACAAWRIDVSTASFMSVQHPR